MSDQEWQHFVLRDLGVSGAGLATPGTPSPAVPAGTTPTPAVPADDAAPVRADVRQAQSARDDQPPVRPVPPPPAPTAPAESSPPPVPARVPAPAPPPPAPAEPRAEPAGGAPPSSPGGRQVTMTFRIPSREKVQEAADRDSRQAQRDVGPAPGGRAPADRQDTGGEPITREPVGREDEWRPLAEAGPPVPEASPYAPDAVEGPQVPPRAPNPAERPQSPPYPPEAVEGPQAPPYAPPHAAEGRPPEPPQAPPYAPAAPTPPYAPAAPGYPSQQPPPYPPYPPSAAEPPASASDDLLRRSRRGDPIMRRMSQGMRKAFGASAAGDVRELAEVTARLRLPVATCRQIAVMSVRGGSGKTTVAALTATVIAQCREDRVLAVDADSGLGSLPLRLGVRAERSVHDLAAVRPRSWEEATGYLTQTGDGAWVLSGTASGRIGAELDLETFQTAAGGLSRYFSAAVIDCGAGIVAALQRGILANAHGQILVAPGTVDGALSARGALDWYAANGFAAVLPRTIVALVTHSPHADADFERAEQLLSAGGMTVINVPYDRYLAAGTAIDTTKISGATRMAVTHIAAEAFVRSAAV